MSGDVQLGPYSKGINTIDDERSLDQTGRRDKPAKFLRQADNVDIDRKGTIRRRAGYSKLMDLVDSHSLYTTPGGTIFLVEADQLKSLFLGALSLTTLTPVTGPVSYALAHDVVYWTDDYRVGRIGPTLTSEPVWTPNPSGTPTVNEAPGVLHPGLYQVTLTYIGIDGEESGASLATQIQVNQGGITLSDIPQTSDATHIRVYMTDVNGSVFSRQIDVPMGNTTVTLVNYLDRRRLKTQFADVMPAGHLLCFHYGRMYVAVGDTVVWSEALQPGLTRIQDNHFPPFKGRIQLMMGSTEGLYIVDTERTWFMPGGDPEEVKPQSIYPHSGVEGTGVEVPASLLGLKDSGAAPCWFSDNGMVAGVDGRIVPLTESQLAVDTYKQGASLYREEQGIRSIVTSVQGKGPGSGLSTTDSVSLTHYRNGIDIT